MGMLLLILLLLLTPLWGQEEDIYAEIDERYANEAAARFCADPYQYVCNRPQVTATEQRYRSRRDDLEGRIWRRKSKAKSMDDLFGPVLEMLGSDLDRASLLHQQSVLDEIRRDLLGAINRQPGLTSASKGAAFGALSNVTIQAPNRLMTAPQNFYYSNRFMEICALEGLRANAFPVFDDDWPLLYLCPGYYLAIAGSWDENNMLSSVSGDRAFLVVAHELGHFIDYSSNPGFPYNRIADCAESYPDAGRERYLREYTADYWAAEALAYHLKDRTDKELMIQFIADTTALFCFSGFRESSTHPSARVFFNDILGLNPELRKLLGCPAPERSRCDLQPDE
ncbi:MAG: hypothetical protein HYT79_07420 [Elusimicrobia bacterium]|nr:hypothetical protein [Elusimicrobiota bacterium]